MATNGYNLQHRPVFEWNGRNYALSLRHANVPPAKNSSAVSVYGGLVEMSDGRTIVLASRVSGLFVKDAADQKPEAKPAAYDAKHVTRLGAHWGFKLVSAGGDATIPNMKHGAKDGMFTASGKQAFTGSKCGLPYDTVMTASITVVDAKDAQKTLDNAVYRLRDNSSLLQTPSGRNTAEANKPVSTFQHAEVAEFEDTPANLSEEVNAAIEEVNA